MHGILIFIDVPLHIYRALPSSVRPHLRFNLHLKDLVQCTSSSQPLYLFCVLCSLVTRRMLNCRLFSVYFTSICGGGVADKVYLAIGPLYGKYFECKQSGHMQAYSSVWTDIVISVNALALPEWQKKIDERTPALQCIRMCVYDTRTSYSKAYAINCI